MLVVIREGEWCQLLVAIFKLISSKHWSSSDQLVPTQPGFSALANFADDCQLKVVLICGKQLSVCWRMRATLAAASESGTCQWRRRRGGHSGGGSLAPTTLTNPTHNFETRLWTKVVGESS